MASDSETAFSSAPSPSFIEALISSRNRDISLLLPFILGLTPPPETQNQDGPRDRIILINPFTHNVLVVDRSSTSYSGLDGKGGPRPASRESIDAMESVEIVRDGDRCAVCLEEWETGERAKEMPCKHRFCGGCIEQWLRVNGSCPVCRYEMPAEEGGVGGGDGGRRRGVWVWFALGSEDESSERS